MASLANQTISSTYDGLIKTSTDAPVGVSGVQLLEDGSGNSLALSVGRANNGVTITGNLAVDTNTLYVDATNNRVGIGTSSPDESLELYSNEASVLIANSSGNVNSTSSVKFSNGSTVEPKAAIFFEDTLSNNRGVLHLAVNSNTLGTPVSLSDAKLTIDNSGNVGIGITPSGAKLDVLGNLRVRRAAASTQYTEIESGGGESKIIAKNGAAATYQALIFESGNNTTTTERMRIDSSGNVGIGESDPSGYWSQAHNLVLSDGNAGLTIKSDTTGNGRIVFTDTKSGTAGLSDGGMIHYDHTGDSMRLHANGSERMRIDSDGNVGINDTVGGNFTTNYNAKLLVGGDIVARSLTSNQSMIAIGGDATSAFIKSGKQDGSLTDRDLRFITGDDERMRITSGGDVLLGTQGSPDGTTYFGSGFISESSQRMLLRLATSTTGAINLIQFYNSNGNVGKIQVSGTATSYITSSDYRLKENVVPMEGALDRVDALKPSRFNFIADPSITVDGFLAHEVAEVIPEAISGAKDEVDEEGNPIYQGIDQSKIVPLLVGAIKELKAEIELLKSQING